MRVTTNNNIINLIFTIMKEESIYIIVNTINRGKLYLTFPFAIIEKNGKTFDAAPNNKFGISYLSKLEKIY